MTSPVFRTNTYWTVCLTTPTLAGCICTTVGCRPMIKYTVDTRLHIDSCSCPGRTETHQFNCWGAGKKVSILKLRLLNHNVFLVCKEKDVRDMTDGTCSMPDCEPVSSDSIASIKLSLLDSYRGMHKQMLVQPCNIDASYCCENPLLHTIGSYGRILMGTQ